MNVMPKMRPSEIVPNPVRRDMFTEAGYRWALAISDTLRRMTRETSTVVNNMQAATGPGVELRQIVSGPMRDLTGRVLDAGVQAVVAPNLAQHNFTTAMQDANYVVNPTGGYVGGIASAGLVPFGIAAVNITMICSVQALTAAAFRVYVRWSAVCTADLRDQRFHMALPPQAAMWDDYAAMAAAYGFAAPYNALATATGLNSIYYTVVDY
jgi:hypothetical protein